MNRMRGARSLVLCIGLLMVGSAPAWAATPDELYHQGLDLYRQHHYGESIAKFQASYDAKQVPRILLDIGMAHLRLKNGRDALFFFRYYLRDALHIPETVRADVEGYIQEAQALLGPQGETAPASFAPVPPVRPAPAPPPSRNVEPDWNASPKPPARQAAMPHPPAPAAPALSKATFVARDKNNHYLVGLDGQACKTPCSLDLVPGARTLTVEGAGRFTTLLALPEGPSMVRIQHFTLGPVIAGSILTPIGVTVTSVGLGLLLSPTYTGDQSQISTTVGWPVLVVGAAILGTGIGCLALIRTRHADVIPLTPKRMEGSDED